MERAGGSREGGASSSPGPLAGAAAGAALAVTVFLLATLIHDRLLAPSRDVEAPEGFAAPGEERRGVRVLTADLSPGVRAALLPLRTDGLPTDAACAPLDDALFPGGPRHLWARLLLSSAPGAGAFTLSLDEGALRLAGDGEGSASLDLATVYAAREPSLTPHRRLDLRVAGVHRRSVQVADGGTARVLVAFPPGVDLTTAAHCELEGGRRLWPLEVTRESLVQSLTDGRITSLEGDLRADVAAPRGNGDDGEGPR